MVGRGGKRHQLLTACPAWSFSGLRFWAGLGKGTFYMGQKLLVAIALLFFFFDNNVAIALLAQRAFRASLGTNQVNAILLEKHPRIKAEGKI